MKTLDSIVKRFEFEPLPVEAVATTQHAQGALAGDSAINLSEGLPFLRAIAVPNPMTLVFLSGHTPPVIDQTAPLDSIAAYGDTEIQTIGVLNEIKRSLEKLNLSFENLVKLQVFAVGVREQNGRMDNEGFSRAYSKIFVTAEQPNKVVRTRIQVAGLVNPGWLVEIEAVAAI